MQGTWWMSRGWYFTMHTAWKKLSNYAFHTCQKLETIVLHHAIAKAPSSPLPAALAGKESELRKEYQMKNACWFNLYNIFSLKYVGMASCGDVLKRYEEIINLNRWNSMTSQALAFGEKPKVDGQVFIAPQRLAVLLPDSPRFSQKWELWSSTPPGLRSRAPKIDRQSWQKITHGTLQNHSKMKQV